MIDSPIDSIKEEQKTMYCPYCVQIIPDEAGRCPVCGRDTTLQNKENALPIGSILANRFYVGAILGQGGFGITYVGCDTKLNKKIAIKEYYPAAFVSRMSSHSPNLTVTAGEDANTYEHERQKFIKEAYLLAEFAGERSVVNVSDILAEHNTAYIIMDFVEGETLESYLGRRGRMSADEAFRLLSPMIESLGRIHAKGLIHRDISPANIMIQADGHVTLLDFGAAREFDNSEEKSISVILKHGYAPTEQYQSHGPQGPWTDVYALCATLYKMVTGITPPSAVDRMVGEIMKRPSELGASIKPAVEAVLMKGMALPQGERYSSMQDFAAAWRAASEGVPAGGNPPVKSEAPADQLSRNDVTEALIPPMRSDAAQTPYAPQRSGQQDYDATEILMPGEQEPQALSQETGEQQTPVPESRIPEITPEKRIEKTPEKTPEKKSEKTRKKKVNRWVLAAAIVCALAAAGLVIYFISSSGTQPVRETYSERKARLDRLSAQAEARNSEEVEETHGSDVPETHSSDVAGGEAWQNAAEISGESPESDTLTGSGVLGASVGFYHLSYSMSVTEALYEYTVNLCQNGSYSTFEGNIGDIFAEYKGLDLDGKGGEDQIFRVAADGGYSYQVGFAGAGRSVTTPTFSAAPNEGTIVTFYDYDGDGVHDLLFSHMTDSTGGPIVTEAVRYHFNGASWDEQRLVSDGEVMVDYYGKEDSPFVRDVELTRDCLALLIDFGVKEGSDQTYDLMSLYLLYDDLEVLGQSDEDIANCWPNGI